LSEPSEEIAALLRRLRPLAKPDSPVIAAFYGALHDPALHADERVLWVARTHLPLTDPSCAARMRDVVFFQGM